MEIINRHFTPITWNNDNLFFSLVDYRNNLFMSDRKEDLECFYDSFRNRDQLIGWMRERPKGYAGIYEFDGNKEIVVVIPTPDINGKFALECRNSIFKGLQIIFVESGEIKDFYFNYAHNSNLGVKHALRYNPKWIVLSNDDVYRIDDVSVLVRELNKINEKTYNSVFTIPSRYHSYRTTIGEQRLIFYDLLYPILSRKIYLENKANNIRKYLKKFNVKTTLFWPTKKLLKLLLFKRSYSFTMTSAFSIFSSQFVIDNNEKLFDETFINGVEDWLLSLNLSRNPEHNAVINYRIGDYIGSTFNQQGGNIRNLRNIVNLVYLDSILDLSDSIFE